MPAALWTKARAQLAPSSPPSLHEGEGHGALARAADAERAHDHLGSAALDELYRDRSPAAALREAEADLAFRERFGDCPSNIARQRMAVAELRQAIGGEAG